MKIDEKTEGPMQFTTECHNFPLVDFNKVLHIDLNPMKIKCDLELIR